MNKALIAIALIISSPALALGATEQTAEKHETAAAKKHEKTKEPAEATEKAPAAETPHDIERVGPSSRTRDVMPDEGEGEEGGTPGYRPDRR